VKLVLVAFKGALKSPLAVQFAPLVTVWLPPVRTKRTVSPGATVSVEGLNASPDCVMVCLVANALETAPKRTASETVAERRWVVRMDFSIRLGIAVGP
jgi:hypothetical protein